MTRSGKRRCTPQIVVRSAWSSGRALVSSSTIVLATQEPMGSFGSLGSSPLLSLGKTEQVISMKRYARRKVQLLGREAQILNERSLIQSLSPSVYVPQVLCTRGSKDYAAVLLNTRLAAPLALILLTPLDESTARFVAASVVLALDFLHKVMYRLLDVFVHSFQLLFFKSYMSG